MRFIILYTYCRYPHRTSEEERERLLIDFIHSYVKRYMRPENPSPVLLYGDNSPAARFHSEWLARRLERIQRERKAVSTYVPQTLLLEEPGFDYFEHFCLTIADSAKEIWILELSGSTFLAHYITFHTMCRSSWQSFNVQRISKEKTVFWVGIKPKTFCSL